MAGERIGKNIVSQEAFEKLEWRTYKESSRKFKPRVAKTARTNNPRVAIQGAFGIRPEESDDLMVDVEALETLELRLKSLIGMTTILRTAEGSRWRDDAQGKSRLFSPLPAKGQENTTSFSVESRTEEENGWTGWDTYLEIHGVADVYDRFMETIDMDPTEVNSHLFRTTRQLGERSVSTSVITPVQAIEVIDDPNQILAIAHENYPHGAGQLLQEMQEALEELRPTVVI